VANLREKGYRFDGPDGQYYILTRNVNLGDYILTSDFEPHGGAPNPKDGERLVEWLHVSLFGPAGAKKGGDAK